MSETDETFGTAQEKAAFLRVHTRQAITIQTTPGLPCTTQDCLNMATVSSAVYRADIPGWEVIATCRDCTIKAARQYGLMPEEGE